MKILVTESIADEAVQNLQKAGYGVDVRLGLKQEELIATVPGYDAVIIRSETQMTREVMEADEELHVIGRAGVSVDNVDIEAATERGIMVCNAPTSNVVSAAEHTMAMMLAVARNVPQANASMHAGKWDRPSFTGTELMDKTLGIFGLGRIGGLVAERAAAFGMKLIGYDPYCSPERAAHLGVALLDGVDDVCRQADFITVHLPKTKETINMFGPKQYAEMKDGVYLINCARGSIFNIDSMADFIAAGKIAGAAIDVFAKEPCTASPLHEFGNVILTPHLGAATKEAQKRAGVQIAEYVALGLEGRMIPTAVNVAPVPMEVMEAVAPYITACQMGGAVIAQIAREGISSLDVEVCGGIAAMDVRVLGTAALRAIFAESSDDPVNFVNADYIAEQRGVTVTLRKDPESTEYASIIRFTAHAGAQTIKLSVTCGGIQGKPRIVSIMGYNLDLCPGENAMVLEYADRPGKLGIIGTVMGKHNINISNMELGSNEAVEGKALVMMNVDQEVPADVQRELDAAVEAVDAWYLHLYGL